jgi:hypothetical protein
MFGIQLTNDIVGRRVEIHPATDTWMRGDRFGRIVRIGRKYARVLMDRSGRTLNFSPDDLRIIE